MFEVKLIRDVYDKSILDGAHLDWGKKVDQTKS